MTFPVAAAVVLGGMLLALLAVVPHGQRRVVLRGGTVRRVGEVGVVWRVPFAERALRVVSEPHELPVRVRATTLDDVPVLVLAEVAVRVLPPEIGDTWADPWPEAEVVAERVLADLVATLPVAQLRYALRAAERRLRERLAGSVGRLGMEVLAVEVLEVELPLASDLGAD
jgi:regulator of protease activity HflC (stomatin/prohibitin superfamily)